MLLIRERAILADDVNANALTNLTDNNCSFISHGGSEIFFDYNK